VIETLLIVVAVALILWLALTLALLATGRRAEARALAGFIPDCIVLFRRLLGDPEIPRRRKLALGATIVYLAMPIDLIPDFFPVIGQLDDAIICALVLRYVLRGGGPETLRRHWPGPDESLKLIVRAAYG
jgi:uncharacterized membrane protein YkvA (DUF1232 family)